MRKIAIVTPILPVPFDPTRGRFIYETAKALSKMAQVRVFLQMMEYPYAWMKPRSYIYGELDEDFHLEGIDVEVVKYPAIPVLSRGLNGFLASFKLHDRMKAFAPELVLGYWVYPDGYAALRSARRLKVPCVLGALGSDIHMRDGLSRHFTRRALQGADAVVTVSEAMRRYTLAEFGADPKAVHTVVNGFNTEVFHLRDQAADRRALNIPADARLMVYVGRFVEAKGLNELIDAFAQMAQDDPRDRLALIGDGVMKADLQARIQALGLQDRIHMPGGLAPQDVATWIGASSLLTLPSWSEGYPNVVVEGVACGRPVVATDVGGTREIIDGSNGILVKPRSVGSLKAGLQEALSRSWPHEAIATAMTRSWDDVARETLGICGDLLQIEIHR